MTLSPETRTKLSGYPDEARAVWYLNEVKVFCFPSLVWMARA